MYRKRTKEQLHFISDRTKQDFENMFV